MRSTVFMSRFTRCKRGATAVEFAFVFPVFLILIFGMFELGMMMFTSVALESLVAKAGREATIGTLSGGGSHSERAHAYIKKEVANLYRGNTATVAAVVLPVAQSNGYVANPDRCIRPQEGYGIPNCMEWEERDGREGYSGSNFGNEEEVVKIIVEIPWMADFGIVRDIFGEDGVTKLESSTIVKNEPFGN